MILPEEPLVYTIILPDSDFVSPDCVGMSDVTINSYNVAGSKFVMTCMKWVALDGSCVSLI